MLVDRLVNYIYMGTYQLGKESEATVLHYATKVSDLDRRACVLGRLTPIQFHMHMYGLAEHLQYEALRATAHQKIRGILLNTRLKHVDPQRSKRSSMTPATPLSLAPIQDLLHSDILVYKSPPLLPTSSHLRYSTTKFLNLNPTRKYNQKGRAGKIGQHRIHVRFPGK